MSETPWPGARARAARLIAAARVIAVARLLATAIGLLVASFAAEGRAAPGGRAPAAAPAPSPPDRGWSNERAFELAREGIDARKAGDAQLCIEKDRASLALEDHPYVKLHLAGCLAATGKLLDALGMAKDALGAALRNGDDELQRTAQERVTELLPRIAHVTLQLPEDTSGIKIVFDNVPVRPALFKQRIAVDPGDHVIEAEQSTGPERGLFKERFTLGDGEDKNVEVVLRPTNLTPGEVECAERAASYEEKLACFERKPTKPDVRIALEASGYTDSTSVHVFSPSINASVVSPTGGWHVAGSYLIDVLSAASPDIVSMASPAYRETRHAASLSGGYKIDTVQLGANGSVSSEPDYLSQNIGVAGAIDLDEKHITPRLGYALTRDRIGLRNTPFSQFERNLTTHGVEAGVTFVMSKHTLLVTGLTFMMERGEQSKLYRYVPMFTPEDAAVVGPGLTAQAVNEFRLPFRPRELVPRERDRVALAARVNHRLASGTLRIEERLYVDTWGILATTTDARYLHDLSSHVRVWPHLRYHLQKGADFYKLAYGVALDDAGVPLLPAYRTTDREWSPMMTISVGGGARIALTGDKAATRYAVLLGGEVMYSYYFASLFITNRTALYGTLGFEVEL